MYGYSVYCSSYGCVKLLQRKIFITALMIILKRIGRTDPSNNATFVVFE